MGAIDLPRSVFDENRRTDEERAYFDLIDRTAEAKTDLMITNGRPSHAVYLIYKFLQSAIESVQIFTGNLKRTHNGVSAYGDPVLAETAINFLRKPNTSLSIIIAEEPDLNEGDRIEEHPFLSRILETIPNANLTVYANTRREIPKPELHFMVMDHQAYRIENDTDNIIALANFGNPSPISVLDLFFQRCTTVCDMVLPLREEIAAE